MVSVSAKKVKKKISCLCTFKSSTNFCSGVPSLLLVDFLHCTIMAGFRTRITVSSRNNFYSHNRRLSESRKKLPEKGCWKHFHNRKCFYRTKKNLYFGYFRQPNILKTCSVHTKSTALIFKTFKQTFISWLSHENNLSSLYSLSIIHVAILRCFLEIQNNY